MSSKPLILVVDDDAPIVGLMRSLLREFGFEPLTAMNGQDALSIARERRPNLVLLDKNMPGMSGEEVIQSLRAEPELKGLTVLILSGESIEPDELRRIGADGSVLKPFDVPELVAQIRKYTASVRTE